MNAWDSLIRSWFSAINLVMLVVVCAVLFGVMNGISSTFTGKERLPDLQIRSPSKLNFYLAKIGERGRARYLLILLGFDLIFPICYALQMSLWLVWFDPLAKRTWLLLLPLFAAALDWCENITIASIVLRYQEGLADPFGWLAAAFTLAKWSVVAISLLAIIASGLICWLSRCGHNAG
jgi:hypothetical protein